MAEQQMRSIYTGIIFLALLTGWAFGQPVIFLLLSIIGLLLWQIREEKKLLAWMRSNSRILPDDLPPVLEEIAAITLRRAEKLRKRKRRYQKMLKEGHAFSQAVPDPTLIVDKDGILLECNKAARDAFGLKAHTDVGMKIQHLIRDAGFAGFWAQADKDESLPFTFHTADERWLEMAKVRLSRGKWLIVARDISRIVRLDAKRKAFIDNASHELKTPITVLSGFLDWMADNEDVPAQWALPLAQMREHAGRMQKLVEDMLTLAGLERPDMQLRAQALYLPDVLQTVAAATAWAEGAQVEVSAPDRTALLDAALIRSALENLVLNAKRHACATEITLFANIDDAGLSLGVRDNGQGIAARHIPHLSERFYRVDEARGKRRGSGLGLAIVKHVAEAHGGHLQVASTVGKGSCFTLRMPVSRVMD